VNIADFQKYVQSFCNEKGFNEINLERRVLYLVTELGEMSKDLLKATDSDQSVEKQKEHLKNLGLEIFDVFWNLTDIANRLDIDLEKAFTRKMEINKHRIWK
jgi:NTP pyrophosphatase (non-canonical NTP hydrolase)